MEAAIRAADKPVPAVPLAERHMADDDWEVKVFDNDGVMGVRQKSSGHVARFYKPAEDLKEMPYQNHTENQLADRGVLGFLHEAQIRANAKGRELGWIKS
jgi:hypothetical protein